MIKSTIDSVENSPAREWPKLMKSNTRIVLFVSEKTGVCIASDQSIGHVGEYSDDWDMACFAPFTGTITLRNED